VLFFLLKFKRQRVRERSNGLLRGRAQLLVLTLLDAFASGALKGPSVQTKLEALEARQGEVAKALAGLLDEPVRLHANLAAIYRRKVAAHQTLLESDATRTEAVEVIRSLVDQVIFQPTDGAGLRSNSSATSPGWSIWPRTPMKPAPFPGAFTMSSLVR
jgi:hypothetical protein